MAELNAQAARIFRITHIDNVPWLLEHGLHSKKCTRQDPNFVQIGLDELIVKRASRSVAIKPHGHLSDYIPFYFTPWSIMMYNIKTGYGDVIRRPNHEIVVLVSSIHRLVEMDVPFVFTNAHAYMAEAEYFNDPRKLAKIDWALLQSRDFKKNVDDPGKQGRYQAEALVHKHMPVGALLGIGCHDPMSTAKVEKQVAQRGLSIPVKTVSHWYF